MATSGFPFYLCCQESCPSVCHSLPLARLHLTYLSRFAHSPPNQLHVSISSCFLPFSLFRILLPKHCFFSRPLTLSLTFHSKFKLFCFILEALCNSSTADSYLLPSSQVSLLATPFASSSWCQLPCCTFHA